MIVQSLHAFASALSVVLQVCWSTSISGRLYTSVRIICRILFCESKLSVNPHLMKISVIRNFSLNCSPSSFIKKVFTDSATLSQENLSCSCLPTADGMLLLQMIL